MAQMSQEEKDFLYQRFTLEGRMYFPNLLEPKIGTNGTKKFETMFAWKFGSNQAEMVKINAFLIEFKRRYHAQVPDQFFTNPVKRFDTYVKTSGQPNAEYLRDCYWLNASSGVDMPPAVVNAQRQPVMDKAEIYSGRNCVISITFWNNKGGKDGTGKKGAGCNLNAVMLMPGGERQEGGGTINVNQIFAGFAADMAPVDMFAQHAPAQPQVQQAPVYAPQPQQPQQYVQQPQYTQQAPQAPAQPQQGYAPQAPVWPPVNNNGNTPQY